MNVGGVRMKSIIKANDWVGKFLKKVLALS